MTVNDDDGCYHVPTSPGQKMCRHLDQLMWARLTIECQARRIVELERAWQENPPVTILNT